MAMTFMFTPNPKQLAAVKAVLFVAALLPFMRLVLFAFTDRLGANPIEFITRNTGDWTLYFLCITLAITPLRRRLQRRCVALRRHGSEKVFLMMCGRSFFHSWR